MECGEKAEDILNNDLIAAINKVGELFNNKSTICHSLFLQQRP